MKTGLGGIFGSVLQNIPQLATQAISGVTGIFNRPITLPGGGTNIGGGGADKEVPTNTNSCSCVEANNCFLPNKATVSMNCNFAISVRTTSFPVSQSLNYILTQFLLINFLPIFKLFVISHISCDIEFRNTNSLFCTSFLLTGF